MTAEIERLAELLDRLPELRLMLGAQGGVDGAPALCVKDDPDNNAFALANGDPEILGDLVELRNQAPALIEKARKWEQHLEDAYCVHCGTLSKDLDPATHWQECPEHPARSMIEKARRVEELEADLRIAAGECVVPLPEPGTDLARVVSANAILRAEIRTLRIYNESQAKDSLAYAETIDKLRAKARNFDRAVAMLKEARYSPQEGQANPESRFLTLDQPEWIGDRVFLTKDLCDRIAALLAEAEAGEGE